MMVVGVLSIAIHTEFDDVLTVHALVEMANQIKNDTGEPNAWYCMFNGRLIKGGKIALQRHIEAYLLAKQKAEQQKK